MSLGGIGVEKIKIVFMGTPDFAAGSLNALIRAGYEITAVVTQPDRPKGRSKELVFSPVKICALEHGIPVLQPEKIKRPEAVEELEKYPADIYIVAAFGQILSQEILDIPRYGCLNIHASLLPKYRGASPIQHVIIDGEEKTGVTIMQMNAGLDTGDMLYKKEIAISGEDTFETLHDKLMVLGGEAITEALPRLLNHELVSEKQDDSLSNYAPIIKKEMGQIDFKKSAVTINRLIRGMNPWPSAYTYFCKKQLKIWRADVKQTTGESEKEKEVSAPGAKPGQVTAVDKNSFTVMTGEGELIIRELQMEGKKRMNAHDFLLGVKVHAGDMLG